MGTAINHLVPDRVKLSFVTFDIRALWRSGLSVRVPDVKSYKWRLNKGCFIAVPIWQQWASKASIGAWVSSTTNRPIENTIKPLLTLGQRLKVMSHVTQQQQFTICCEPSDQPSDRNEWYSSTLCGLGAIMLVELPNKQTNYRVV